MRYTDPTGHMIDNGCNNGECGGPSAANIMLEIAKHKPRYRKQTLKIIAKTSSINLAPGDKWDYAASIMTGDDASYGWTPSKPNDPFKDAEGVQHRANDTSVFITGDLFGHCDKADCVAAIMAHEATHSWIEAKIEEQGKDRNITDGNAGLAEEAFADVVAMGGGDPKGDLTAHYYAKMNLYTDQRLPSAYLAALYNIDLSNISQLIFGR